MGGPGRGELGEWFLATCVCAVDDDSLDFVVGQLCGLVVVVCDTEDTANVLEADGCSDVPAVRTALLSNENATGDMAENGHCAR